MKKYRNYDNIAICRECGEEFYMAKSKKIRDICEFCVKRICDSENKRKRKKEKYSSLF